MIVFTVTCFLILKSRYTATTFLSSKRTSLVTIYNISQQEDQLIYANDSPYSIFPPGSHFQYPGETLLQHGPCDVTVLRIDEQAKIHCLQLCDAPTGDSEVSHAVGVEKSDVVEELEKIARSTKSKLQKYGDQDKSTANLYPAYDCEYHSEVDLLKNLTEEPKDVFRLQTEKQEKVEGERAEEFHDLMDRLPTFWQTYDAPVESMLTR